MPFVTEELWQRLPGRQEQAGGVASIMIASYPAAQPSWSDPTAEAELALILDVKKAARSLRSGEHEAAGQDCMGYLCPFCITHRPSKTMKFTRNALFHVQSRHSMIQALWVPEFLR